jgi:hypothetical protein
MELTLRGYIARGEYCARFPGGTHAIGKYYSEGWVLEIGYFNEIACTEYGGTSMVVVRFAP